MATPTTVLQKPPTAKALQYDGTNLSDFQNWLGSFPVQNNLESLSGQPIAISNGDGTITLRSVSYGPRIIVSGMWVVQPDASIGEYLTYADDAHYQAIWS
jgi:hypothetical protein